MDLHSLDHSELVKLRKEIDQAILEMDSRNREEALRAARRAVAEFGLTLGELVSEIKQAEERSLPGVPRYRNPANPSQTWTGRGRRPKWVHDLEAAGFSLDDAVID